MKPQERFSGTSQDYARYRPDYPAEALDWIARTAGLLPGSRILDVGCGTGISARQWAARGFAVTGLEPNAEMLAHARAAGGGPQYLRGEAERTGLPDAAFDLACGAQSFHWFELAAALPELKRVLKPGGWSAALWNRRAPCPFHGAYEALLRRHCADYDKLPKTRLFLPALRAAAGPGMREAAFPHAQRFDREGLRGRARSTSYVAHGLREPEAFFAGLDELFDRFSRSGELEFPYETVVLAWPKPPRRDAGSPARSCDRR